MNGQYLEDVEEEKDLGVLVDNELKFHKQVAAVVKNANSKLGLIKKSFATLDVGTLPLLYTSLVRSKLEYGNLIWDLFIRKMLRPLRKCRNERLNLFRI